MEEKIRCKVVPPSPPCSYSFHCIGKSHHAIPYILSFFSWSLVTAYPMPFSFTLLQLIVCGVLWFGGPDGVIGGEMHPTPYSKAPYDVLEEPFEESNRVVELTDETFLNVLLTIENVTAQRIARKVDRWARAPASDPKRSSLLFSPTALDADAPPPPPTWFVMFYAPWCGHCQKVMPEFFEASNVIAQESAKHSDNMARQAKGLPMVRQGARFAIVDATKHVQVANAFDVRSFPKFGYVAKGHFYQHDSGQRFKEHFVFVGRFLYFGSVLGFVNDLKAATVAALRTGMTTDPPRVAILLHVDQPATDRDIAAGSHGAEDAASSNGASGGSVTTATRRRRKPTGIVGDVTSNVFFNLPNRMRSTNTLRDVKALLAEDGGGEEFLNRAMLQRYVPQPTALDVLLMSSISYGHVSFFVYPFPSPFPKGKRGTLSDADASFVSAVDLALERASRSRDGVAMVAMSDEEDLGGAIPFEGSWRATGPCELARFVHAGKKGGKKGRLRRNSNLKAHVETKDADDESGEEGEGGEAGRTEGDAAGSTTTTAADLSTTAVTSRFIRDVLVPHCPTSAAKFVFHHALFPVEIVTTDTFRPLVDGKLAVFAVAYATTEWLSQKGLASTLGLSSMYALESSPTHLTAKNTLLRVVQRHHHHSSFLDDPNIPSSSSSSEKDDDDDVATPRLAPSPASQPQHFEFRFGVMDGTIYAEAIKEWLGPNYVEGRPEIFIYDGRRENFIFYNRSLFEGLVDAAWGSDVERQQQAVREVGEGIIPPKDQLVFRVEALLRQIRSGDLQSIPASFIGRIIAWIPYAREMQDRIGIDDDYSFLMIAGTVLLMLVVLPLSIFRGPATGGPPAPSDNRCGVRRVPGGSLSPSESPVYATAQSEVHGTAMASETGGVRRRPAAPGA